MQFCNIELRTFYECALIRILLMDIDVAPSKTPSSSRTAANFCSSTPRRRSGRKRTQSDTYRKVALTRSASQALRIQKPMLASRSYSLRNKPLILQLLADSGPSNFTKNQDQENSIQRSTLTLDSALTKSTSNGKISTNRKVKATSIKLNLLKSNHA
jgi:hypothetical protein